MDYNNIYLFSLPTIFVGHALGITFKEWEKTQDNSDFFDELPNNPR